MTEKQYDELRKAITSYEITKFAVWLEENAFLNEYIDEEYGVDYEALSASDVVGWYMDGWC